MARQHAGTAVISEGHKDFKEVVNIRTAGAASKCSAVNAIHVRLNSSQKFRTIRIWLNSLKPLFSTPYL